MQIYYILTYLSGEKQKIVDVQFEECIEEIVIKENERYKLSTFNLIDSVNSILQTLFSNDVLLRKWGNTPFTDFRKEVLEILYLEHILPQIPDIFSADKEIYKEWIFSISKDILKRIQIKHRDVLTIDKDLDPNPDTIAFKASHTYLAEILDWNKYQQSQIILPELLERKINETCLQKYPIGIHKFIDLLKKDDRDLWKTTSHVIYKIAGLVIKYYCFNKNNSDDLRSDTWIKSNEKIYNLIISGEAPDFESGLHLRNYIAKINLNNLRNIQKKEHLINNTNVTISDFAEIHVEDRDSTDYNDLSFFDIDINNEQEVKFGLINILYNKPKGVYDTLAKGIEDKLDMLIQHSEGESYREIAIKKYGVYCSPEKLKKDEDNIRQGVSRAKKTIIFRFYELLKKQLKYE
ncbi:hypothetical protein CLV62_14429 [Dysgonomonas alginatilytica]|uniref:Uncharacterized protein n=1 Tax=Dysgonomonas alginatilytica TaxID=1605892 RepID=A0A2V3PHZ5_9BACT|nr:hypothetical protein [Dysgonomonas alginatilytica]PXV58817.1 hypothetical protein CLV62_14429 [Dysgonomonas alginatilytica]